MSKETSIVDETETVSDDTSIDDTSNNNTSIEASDKRYNIMEEMQTSGVFKYPKLDEFLEGRKTRPALLTELEIVDGKFGESVALRLDNVWYRSSSKPILEESKYIKEHDLFPCDVFVTGRLSENGRTYYTLRGGEDE